MKYFKIGNQIYGENNVVNDGDLVLFGDMPKDAFLRRILNCYNIDLCYDLENRQIMIKDLETNQFLNNNPNSSLWNNLDTTVNLNYDCNEKLLIVDIKRQSGLDITLKVDLVNSIDWFQFDKKENNKYSLSSNDNLIAFKFSKYGKCEFKNNASNYSFIYNTEQLNSNSSRAVTINITSSTTQNRINYNVKDGELSTIYCHSENNKLIKNNNEFTPIEECDMALDQDLNQIKNKSLFTEDLYPIKSVINDDLDCLKQLSLQSRVEYLLFAKKSLSNKIKQLFTKIRNLFNSISETQETLNQIDNELLELTKNDINDDIKVKKYASNGK